MKNSINRSRSGLLPRLHWGKLLPVFILLFSFFSLTAQTKTTVWVPMKDGVKLATDIYQLATQKTGPVILIRTPYQKEGIRSIAKYFATKNFIVVIQDVRGKYSSEGKFIPFINETQDGNTMLGWLSKQKWCNGNVGMWGSSYLGYSALRLTDTHHPNLKSVFNISGWIDGYKVNSPGGAFHQMLIVPWLLNEGQKTRKSVKDMDFETIFKHTPMIEVLPDLNFEVRKGDRISLKELNPDFAYQKAKVPVMHWSGWYDFVANATIDAYASLKKQGKGKQYLVIGPWYHNQWYHENPQVGDYVVKKNAQAKLKYMLDQAIAWFEQTLRSPSLPSSPSVKYYVLFEDAWKTAQQWPPANTHQTLFYLSQDGKLNPQRRDAQNPTTTFIYDPMKPVPTIAGANFHFFLEQMGMKKQNQLEQRKDVLTFTTPAFRQSKTVAGNIKAQLFVASEGLGTDFTATLTKVDTAGNSWNLVDGITRIPSKKLKGKVAKVNVELGNIAFQLKAGERIRLQISSSNFPKYNRNPNTGISPFDAVKFKAVKQTIYHNSQYPSSLTIPFLK
ncbi:MAG TPA: hypothetical protein DCS93_15980 [Microscillaceae bacterium]|nr:hypothetical protein [Microscillaceae bacterium]